MSGIHPLATLLAFVARLLTGVTVRWVDSEPSLAPRVYYGNHSSHLDAVVLWASLPRAVRARAHPVAAEDYWNASALRRYFADRVFRALLIDRRGTGDREQATRTIERLAATIGAGDSLIVFPEGTRGSGEQIAPFKSGIYHLAARCPGLQFVPVWLENLNRILPKGEVLLVPLVARATFGPPIALASGEGKPEFLERARAALCRLKEA